MNNDKEDTVSLTVGGKKIDGWDSVRITRGIERFPSDFDLGLMDYYPGSDEEQRVREGDPCVIRIGNDTVITGYTDDWEPSISRSRHEVRATGRGKCQDLTDCSAEWPNNVINGGNALDIASRLASYYGINVTSDVDDMVAVPQFTLNWGESPQEIIERVSRWSALLYYDLPDGTLHLTSVGTRRAASGLAQGENVEDAAYRRYGRSRQLYVTTDSWRDKAGTLWEPNTLIPVHIPQLNINNTAMLLTEVTYIRDEDGTHARMTLMPPAAFSVQPYAFYQQIMELNG